MYFVSFFAKEKHLLFCYRIVLSLQKMLRMAVEVDKDPTYNSDKLSEELFSCLNRMCSCRKTRWGKKSILQVEVAVFYLLNDQSFTEMLSFHFRLLLLSTLESKLLRCKLLKLLLDEACSEKTRLPMSPSLLLHYLKISTLASEPSVKLYYSVLFQINILHCYFA